MIHTDPAWEEYMHTGIDPTGGDLEPESSDYNDDEDNE